MNTLGNEHITPHTGIPQNEEVKLDVCLWGQICKIILDGRMIKCVVVKCVH